MVHRELKKCAIKKAGIIDYILAFLRIYKKIQVIGHSMWPLLKEGDTLYVRNAEIYKKNDILVAYHPYKKICIVKRVASKSDAGYNLEGFDQIESEDSKSFGAVQAGKILGKVVARS